jgi:hypothetical protein
MQNLLTVRIQLHGEQKLDNADESCEMKDKWKRGRTLNTKAGEETEYERSVYQKIKNHTMIIIQTMCDHVTICYVRESLTPTLSLKKTLSISRPIFPYFQRL